MSVRRHAALTAAAVLLLAGQLMPASAVAEPDAEQPQPEATEPMPPLLHNVTYRARADGTSRGAVVVYKADDHNVNSEQPTMLPGQTFEVNTVMADPNLAGMELSIEWPYGSNLHCEILVDDQIVAQADQFIAPRLFRPKDDPLYGVLQCGAPLNDPASPLTVPAGVPELPGYPGQPAPAAPPQP
ncbi:hypothetical protein ACWDUN_27740 [Mycobacterium sp. NPDC003323]